MNIWTRRFCEAVFVLDHIPRYGRMYAAPRPGGGMIDWSPPQWVWQRRGLWGFYLLAHLGLLTRYIDEVEPKEPL